MADVTHDEIQSQLVTALAKSLALQPEQIRSSSRLIDDLGMDSLDFLDLTFSLERAFDVKLRDRDFDRLLRPEKTAAHPKGEFLTAQELQELGAALPRLAQAGAEGPVRRAEVYSFLTVDALVGMIARKLAAREVEPALGLGGSPPEQE
jgi:acyl carrier protein